MAYFLMPGKRAGSKSSLPSSFVHRVVNAVHSLLAEFQAVSPVTGTSVTAELEACLIEDCDGYGHPDECTRQLGETTIGRRVEISTELVVGESGRHISVFGLKDGRDEALIVRCMTRADLLALAAQFADVAALIERAVDELPEDALDGDQAAYRAYALGR